MGKIFALPAWYNEITHFYAKHIIIMLYPSGTMTQTKSITCMLSMSRIRWSHSTFQMSAKTEDFHGQ